MLGWNWELSNWTEHLELLGFGGSGLRKRQEGRRAGKNHEERLARPMSDDQSSNAVGTQGPSMVHTAQESH